MVPAAHRLLQSALKGRVAVLENEEVDLNEVVFPCGCTPEQICPRLADFSVQIEGNEVILSDFYYIGNHFPKIEIENYVYREVFKLPYFRFATEAVKLAEQVLVNYEALIQNEEEELSLWIKDYCTKISFLINRVKMKLSSYNGLAIASDTVSFLLRGQEDKALQKMGEENHSDKNEGLTPILELLQDPMESRRFLGIRFFRQFRGCLTPLNRKLLEILPESSPAVQYAIIKTLEEAPYEQIISPILDFFCNQEELTWPLIRDLTGLIAKYLNRCQLQNLMVERLTEGKETTQQRILYLLSEQERIFPAFRRPLINLLREEKNAEDVLRWAGTVLARYRGREVDRVFADLVANEAFSWEIRQQCVAYLPRTLKNIRLLSRYLRQREIPVRFLCAVIEQLGIIGGEETIEPLISLIETPEEPEEVRRTAIWTLFMLMDGGNPSQIYDILGHCIDLGPLIEEPRVLSVSVSAEPIQALTRMRVQWVMFKLLFNRQETELVRATIAGCLDRLVDPQTVKILLRLVQDPQEKYLVRANALHALERTMVQGDLAPLPVLQEMSKSFGVICKGTMPIPMYGINGNFDPMVAFALLLEGVIARVEQRIGN